MKKLFRLFLPLLLSFMTLFSITASSTLAADSRRSTPQEEPAEVIYVANTSDDCGTFTPCYFNSDEDGEDGSAQDCVKHCLPPIKALKSGFLSNTR